LPSGAVIIVYQILYSDVSDHWPEYATLKAGNGISRSLSSLLFFSLNSAALWFFFWHGDRARRYHFLYRYTIIADGDGHWASRFLPSFPTAMMCTISAQWRCVNWQTAGPSADIFFFRGEDVARSIVRNAH